jgi:hypothetical protein
VRRSGWRVLGGLLLVAIGMLILVDRVNGIGGNGAAPKLLRGWWPLIIVAAGCFNLLRLINRPWLLVGPVLSIAVGLVVLSFTAGPAAERIPVARDHIYPVAWPAGVVLAGFWIALTGSDWTPRKPPAHGAFREVVLLRGKEIANRGAPFRRGRVLVVLGYLRLNLREAQFTAARGVLDITVVFGRVRVLVPNGVTTEIRQAFVLTGGRLTHTLDPPGTEAGLVVNVLALFGDADVAAPTARPSSGARSTV